MSVIREVEIKQNIITSTVNTTEDNLAPSGTFTGDAEETLGINSVQIYHYADVACTVYLDQGLDGVTWDIIDSFDTLPNIGYSRPFLSAAPYFRIRVTNTDSVTSTELRSSAGMTPILSVLPKSLSGDDRLTVESTLVGQQNTNRHVWVTPQNSLSTSMFTRLVGTNFDGLTKDPNFWQEDTDVSGTVVQAGGEIEVRSGAGANGYAQYDSVRTARFVVGAALQWQAIVKFVTADTTDNVRRIGAYSDTDGFFFQLDGSDFSVGYRKESVDTIVSGSFNGNYGASYDPDNNSYSKYAIEWGPKGVFFYVDGVLLHKDGQGHRSDFLSLPIRFESVNSNGLDEDVVMDILASAIGRYGQLVTNPTSYYQAGTVAAQVLKYGAGTVRGIVISGIVNNSVVTLYDATAATGGTEIFSTGQMDPQSQPFSINFFGLPFSTGLTLAIAGANSNVTVIYE